MRRGAARRQPRQPPRHRLARTRCARRDRPPPQRFPPRPGHRGHGARPARQPEGSDMIEVYVNGSARELADTSTVADLLTALDIRPAGVAVAVNRVVVPRAEHDRTVLPDGASVEVLTAV